MSFEFSNVKLPMAVGAYASSTRTRTCGSLSDVLPLVIGLQLQANHITRPNCSCSYVGRKNIHYGIRRGRKVYFASIVSPPQAATSSIHPRRARRQTKAKMHKEHFYRAQALRSRGGWAVCWWETEGKWCASSPTSPCIPLTHHRFVSLL